MQLLVEVPTNLPDAAQCTPEQFMQEAKLAMAIKLYELTVSGITDDTRQNRLRHMPLRKMFGW